MSKYKDLVFRNRDKVAVVLFLAVLLSLVRYGQTLRLGEPAEDWIDVFGCVIAACGHALRLLALRHIGPASRTRKVDTSRLVTDGPYAVIRNPLYVGNMFIATGICIAAQTTWFILVGPVCMLLLYHIVVLAEERYLLQQFGFEYQQFCTTTPRFFPRSLFGKRGWDTLLYSKNAQGVLRTKEYQAFLATGLCMLLIEFVEHIRRAHGVL